MGYVYERKGKCYIAYRRPDGRWMRESAGTNKKTLARAMLSQREREMVEAKVSGLPIQSDIRLEEFVKEYLDYAEANKKPRALESDQTSLKKLLPLFGKMKLREITPGAVQRYVDQRCLVKRKNGKRLRASTIRNEVHTLSAIYREAIRRGVVQFNPVSRVRKPKEDNTIVRYLTPDEEQRLFEKLPTWMKPLIVTALHTGMRKGEILALAWADVDFDQRLIVVRNTKSNRKRYIPTNDLLIETLKSLLTDPKPVHVFTNAQTEDGFKDISRAWEKAQREANLRDFRFHDLRHTFASRLAQAGVPILVVKDLLGHKDITTTMRYAHLAPGDMHRAVDVLVPKKEPTK